MSLAFPPEMEDILARTDHTCLKPDAVWTDIEKFLDEGMRYRTASVCIPPFFVRQASDYIQKNNEKYDGYNVKICTVIGFPLGANTNRVKCFEAMDALQAGVEAADGDEERKARRKHRPAPCSFFKELRQNEAGENGKRENGERQSAASGERDAEIKELHRRVGDIEGLFPSLETAVPAEIQTLLDQRAEARKAKNWAESDRLRDAIAAVGWLVKDSKDGQTVMKK